MSYTSLNANRHSLLTSQSQASDFVALAAALQNTAQALLLHCEHAAGPVATHSLQENGSHVAPEIELNVADSDYCGETRSYHFSPSVVRSERELLKKYQVKDFRGLITETHVLLVGMVKLMKSVHPDARIRGYVISSLGCLLEQASILTIRMQNVYNKVELLPPTK